MNKALDGINLVEFDSNLGAAYAAMLLAEQGARAVQGGTAGRRSRARHGAFSCAQSQQARTFPRPSS